LTKYRSPGKATDDEIMYGSGRSNDPVHSGNTGALTGEGSHFDNSRDPPSGTGLGSSNVGNAPTTAGPHSTDLANKADPRVDSDLDGSPTAGDTTGAYSSTGRSSMPGAFESGSNPYSTRELDPRVGGPTSTSGLGSDTMGTGYDTTGQETGYASQRTTGASDGHLGRDAAAVGTAGVVGEGIRHHRQDEREYTGTSTGASGTGYGDSTGIGNTSSNATTGPHSSNLLNKLDPRVDTNTSRTEDNTSSGPHYGRDAAVVGGAAAVGEGIHHHRENERDNLGTSGYSGTTPSGAGSAYYSGPTGTSVSEVSGPHATSAANRLDPMNNQSGRPIEDAHRHDPVTGGGGVAADEAHGGSRHHLGRDAAVGAGGVGLAEHEHRKHEREREAGMGSSTGIDSNTGVYGDNSTYDNTTGTATGPHKSSLLNKLDPRVDSNSGTTDNTGSGHHYGRDAAVGAGGVGLAEHEHRKHERERETGVGSTTGIGSNTRAYNDDPAYAGTTGSTGHHYGRDAAVGAGGIGLAEHEHRKHEREREAGTGNVGIGETSGTYGNDPSYGDTTGPSGHHYGRDAAVGAGGVGLAEHEHRKHERERESGIGSSTGTTAAATSDTGPAPNTAGPHSKDWMNRLDPRVDHNANKADKGLAGTRGTGHEGRDAAAGAGLVGAAGYEAEKHHAARSEPGIGGVNTESLPNFHHTGRDASAIGAATALDENEKARLRAARGERDSNYNQGSLEPGYSSTSGGTGPYDPGYNPTTTGPMHEQSRDHHLGRDAVGAGVVGGAAYEAEKHHKNDKDLTAAEREEKREHNEEKKHHGLLSFLRKFVSRAHSSNIANPSLDRDKNKKYTKEEEDEFDRQEREYHSHAGRDAAVGGAAVGGAAYEAEKVILT
jgi:hypothetical protein